MRGATDGQIVERRDGGTRVERRRRYARPRYVIFRHATLSDSCLPASSVALLVARRAVAAAAVPKAAPATDPAEHALSGLAAQHVAVLPTYTRARRCRGSTGRAAIGRPATSSETLDADIVAAFDERGLAQDWIFPADARAELQAATRPTRPIRTRSAEEPLRVAVARVRRPTARAARVAAAHARRAARRRAPRARAGGAALRAGRATGRSAAACCASCWSTRARRTCVWIGEIASDTAAAFGPAITASIACAARRRRRTSMARHVASRSAATDVSHALRTWQLRSR